MTAGELVAAVLGGTAAVKVMEAVGRLLWGVYQGWRTAQASAPRTTSIPDAPTLEARVEALERVRKVDAERVTDAALERAAVKAMTRIMDKADEVRRQPPAKPKEKPTDERRSEDPDTDPLGRR